MRECPAAADISRIQPRAYASSIRASPVALTMADNAPDAPLEPRAEDPSPSSSSDPLPGPETDPIVSRPSPVASPGPSAPSPLPVWALDPRGLTAALEDRLHRERCYETQDGLLKRREVLKNLNVLVKQWIQSVSLSRGMHWQDIDRIGGRIVTYGSYMLGISHQGADIDALCIAPQHITRQEYFSSFFTMLGFQSEVSNLRAIQEAYVPVIKMTFSGIEIDMTFARLNFAEVPTDTDFLDMPLDNLEPKCIRSLNGYRSTQALLGLVPNRDTFTVALRAIKQWAKGQGLYSNILGYLGGFSWAVLVAKICMMNPDCTAAELVFKFFEVYSTWKWPSPVALTDFTAEAHPTPSHQHQSYSAAAAAAVPGESSSTHESSSAPPNTVNGLLTNVPHQQSGYSYTQHSSWNPDKNPQERHQVMPIITPTYPHINSTFNVTQSTLNLIKEKMASAEKLCKKIFTGEEQWETLFKTNHIFHEYHHLLLIIVCARNNYIQWFGLIESKIRHFIINVEKESYMFLQSARIWPKPLTRNDPKTNITRQLWFVGLEFNPEVKVVRPSEMVDIKKPLRSFQETLKAQARDFYMDDMTIDASHAHKTDLQSQLTENDIQGSGGGRDLVPALVPLLLRAVAVIRSRRQRRPHMRLKVFQQKRLFPC